MVTKFKRDGNVGYMGILGPTRMNYPYNRAMMEEIKDILEAK
jgi:transcriptional regulator of heat shock response